MHDADGRGCASAIALHAGGSALVKDVHPFDDGPVVDFFPDVVRDFGAVLRSVRVGIGADYAAFVYRPDLQLGAGVSGVRTTFRRGHLVVSSSGSFVS